ncbi:variant erythrocyte surface antigen-1 family protein [Babesia caballi]|uniref:Variant erythrocyte surface antigen-1 family protein n=1 Tax=Babesia caballi TaxID=5871 RepID=A0AAV4LQU0_BABCB|nr:variant erythrocyte surface antigen-1 family protein [Babesia caballi]
MGESQMSLTEPPKDLKEAIDWLVRIAFLDKGGKLKDAVEALEDFTSVTKRIGDFNVQGPFNYVCKALKTLIGYNTVGGTTLTDNGIARKDTPCYTSSYGSSAQWDDDMNTPTSDKAKKVALIFLCYVPILYLGITYLFWQCSNTQSHVGWMSLQLRSIRDPLYLFMSNMGFDMQALQDKSGSDIATLLQHEMEGFDDFKNVSKAEYSYSSFLQKLEQKHGRDKLNANAISSPMHTLYLASTAYLKYRFNEGKDVDTTFAEIKEKIQTFRASFNSDQDLKDAIETFIQTCLTKPRKHDAPDSSTAGPVAGTLTTLGLGGGAAAAYILDLGGAKTLILHYPPVSTSLDRPSNLKEAIDWILRVTGKDTVDGSQNGTKQLADAVEKLLGDVTSYSPELQKKVDEIKGALGTPSTGLIESLATGLATFIGYNDNQGTIGANGIAVGQGGNPGPPWKPGDSRSGKKGYVYSYDPAEANWKSDGTSEQICAKVFLGCVPMIFSALSYLYWRCDGTGNGEWKAMKIGGDSNGRDLSYFMYGMGYDPHINLDMTKNGSQVVVSAFKLIKEFPTVMGKASPQVGGQSTSPSTCAYATFTQKLREEVSSQAQAGGLEPHAPQATARAGAAEGKAGRLAEACTSRSFSGYDDYLRVVVAERLEFHLLAEVLVVLGGDPDLNYGDAVLAFVSHDDEREIVSVCGLDRMIL